MLTELVFAERITVIDERVVLRADGATGERRGRRARHDRRAGGRARRAVLVDGAEPDERTPP